MRFGFSLILIVFMVVLLSSCARGQKPVQPAAEPIKAPAPVETRQDWQIQWDNTLAGAKKEGKVTLYAAYGLADARDIFIETVRKKFGLDLEVTVARGPQLSAKLTTERNAGLYLADVYMGGQSDIVASIFPAKIPDPIEPGLILPEIKDSNAWLGGKIPIWDKERRVFSSLAQIGSRTAINTTMAKPEDIAAYNDIINPKWKGKIAMTDPTISGSGGSWVFLAGRLMGTDYVKEVVKQEPFITRDSRLLSEWLARGKYAVGLGIDTSATKTFIELGAPLYLVPRFKEGMELRGSSGHVFFISKAPHPNGARLFVNWILSKDGQTVLSRANGVASRRVDVPTDHLEEWQIPDIKAKYYSGETEEAQAEEIKAMELSRELFAPLLK